MRIGISCYPTYGGSGAVATELGLKLAEEGHEIHFISYAQPFRLDGFRERVFFHEVEMEQYPLFEHSPYSEALAVAIDGDAIVVGSRHDDDGASNAGSAYVFRHGSEGWQQEEKLTASDAALGAEFGSSVAISGDRVVVGAPLLDTGSLNSGGLYAYRRDVLLRLASLPQTDLEQIESLEQLRALAHGIRIRVVDTDHDSVGVDTAEDLARVRQRMLAETRT